MSLDISLVGPEEDRDCTCSRCGETHKTQHREEFYTANITHNLGEMAEAAGIYQALWRPEEIGIKTANQLIPPLKEGLAKLEAEPERYKALNPENGWGSYEGLVEFTHAYLAACMNYPDAEVQADRGSAGRPLTAQPQLSQPKHARTMLKIHRARLEKLIAFLQQLPPKNFNFAEEVTRLEENECGSVCCAIGWTPKLHPRLVQWDREYDGLMIKGVDSYYAEVAGHLYGIPIRTADFLFAPCSQDLVHEKLPICRGDATPKQVAKMLRKFLALVDSGAINLSKGGAH